MYAGAFGCILSDLRFGVLVMFLCVTISEVVGKEVCLGQI